MTDEPLFSFLLFFVYADQSASPRATLAVPLRFFYLFLFFLGRSEKINHLLTENFFCEEVVCFFIFFPHSQHHQNFG